MDISDMRRDFESEGLDRNALDENPVQQFQLWFEDARKAGLLEPNAMSLATTGTDGMPDLRTVLLDQCGHWIPMEQAAEVNREILAFLEEIHGQD